MTETLCQIVPCWTGPVLCCTHDLVPGSHSSALAKSFMYATTTSTGWFTTNERCTSITANLLVGLLSHLVYRGRRWIGCSAGRPDWPIRSASCHRGGVRDHHAVGWCTTLLAAAALALSACSSASDTLSHTSSTAATDSNTTIASSAPTSPSPPSALTAPSPASVSAEIPLETPPDPATSAPASTEPVNPASEQLVPDAPGAAETGPAVSSFAGSVNSI